MIERNVFIFWTGNDFKLIKVLRNILYLHSTNGKGYNVKFITLDNIHTYLDHIPHCFYELCHAHKADYIRVQVVNKYGGIWFDSDILVMSSLDPLFEILETTDQLGFFVTQNNKGMYNGFFGSKPKTKLMTRWCQDIDKILQNANGYNLDWEVLGNKLLDMYMKEGLFETYKIYPGLDTVYPVNWLNQVNEFLEKPYDNYKTIVRNFQPVIVLVNNVYKMLESKSVNEIIYGNTPLSYFIQKSYSNMKHLVDMKFIEIGTSNFETLIETSEGPGLSVEPVQYYLNCLPNKQGVKKINAAISSTPGTVDVYYIPEKVIDDHKLPSWFKGCNTINNYHPLHKKHNVTHLCIIDKVKCITPFELIYTYCVRSCNYLKIDTEGHDWIILKSLYDTLVYLPKFFYPKEIFFESNEHTRSSCVDEVLALYRILGYKIKSRGYNTHIVL